MCGIMGYVGEADAAPIVLDGLSRLEYRGYDSAGIAILDDDGALEIAKDAGKLENLRRIIGNNQPKGHAGIGHTRWATHGRATGLNAHPHKDSSGDVVVIHNGIVENYLDLKSRLVAAGHTFVSETDTEVIPHLIAEALAGGCELAAAVRTAAAEIRGSAALASMRPQDPRALCA